MKVVLIGLLLAFLQSCLGIKVFHVSSDDGTYQLSYWGAHEACQAQGAHLATKAELEDLRKTNFSLCKCGWTLDKSAWYPMTYAAAGCGGNAGLHSCYWGDKWDAYCFEGDAIGKCSAALGIESQKIHYSQMYASSEFKSWWPIFSSSRWKAQLARLHNKDLVNAWIPKYNGRKQWLEVDLEVPTAITGIITQGASRLGNKMWVTSFVIKYSKDAQNYKVIEEDGAEKVFEGNIDNDGLKRNMFPEPVLARYIQFLPVSYHSSVALRLELLGCDMETYEAAQALSRDMDVQIVDGGASRSDIFTEMEPPEK